MRTIPYDGFEKCIKHFRSRWNLIVELRSLVSLHIRTTCGQRNSKESQQIRLEKFTVPCCYNSRGVVSHVSSSRRVCGVYTTYVFESIQTGTEAIMKQFPTPKSLYSNLNSKSERKHAVATLKDIRGGNQLKSLGPVLAGSICEIWRTIK